MLLADYRAQIVDKTLRTGSAKTSVQAWEDVLLAELGLLGATLEARFLSSYATPFQLSQLATVLFDGASLGLRVSVRGDVEASGGYNFGRISTTLEVIRVTHATDWMWGHRDVLANSTVATAAGLTDCAPELRDADRDSLQLQAHLRDTSLSTLSAWQVGDFAERLSLRLAP